MTRDLAGIVDEALAAGRVAAGRGAVAGYIPELAKADPQHVGLAVATLEGGRYAAGEAHVPFTFQSVSKVFSLALVLRRQGA